MLEMIGAVVQSLFGLAIFFGVIYALVKAVTGPLHEKLDRLLAAQDELTQRIADLERNTTEHV